jgi:hypothetical protein
VVATIGRMDQFQVKGRVETLIRSLSRFSEQALLIISGNSDVSVDASKIGSTLIFERLWQQTGIQAAIQKLLPIVEKLQKRFKIERICIVADRGMISSATVCMLESPDNQIAYILGVRMRKVKEIKQRVLSNAG